LTPASFSGLCISQARQLLTFALGLLVLAAAAPLMRSEEGGLSKNSWESEWKFGAVARTKFRGASETSDAEAINVGTRDVLSHQIKEGFLIRFGFAAERYSFSRTDFVGVPAKLQTASLVLGGDFQLGDAWIFRLELEPGLFSAGAARLNAHDFNCPVTIGGSYFVGADLQLVAGVSIDANRRYPVLPAVGLRWKLSESWLLDAILPTPRLAYIYNKSTQFYVGADFADSSYRNDGESGDGRLDARLDGAMLEFTEICVGVGASWKLYPGVTLEVEAGAVPFQEFDYHRAGVRVRSTHVPPYAAFSVKADF
jgi:hypothetical protein